MNQQAIYKIVADARHGRIDTDAAVAQIVQQSIADLGFAQIDVQRQYRTGQPEVIFCQGKTPEQVMRIATLCLERNGFVMGTRAEIDHVDAVRREIPQVRYDAVARIFHCGQPVRKQNPSFIAVCTAGTSDIAVAEEAAVTAELLGNRVERFYDIGVAGIHRLFRHIDRIRQANVVLAVAGMDGAMPSVLAGLISRPLIAVPTSVGYGAAFHGVAALLSMLNSCACGVSVVNIDNGFGAAYQANMINQG